MNKDSKILIVGSDDVIERSLFSYFEQNGFSHVWSSSEIGLNAAIQPAVCEFFQKNRPEYIFLGSTKSGGIEANIKYPADFIYDNLASQGNVLYNAWKFGTKKLLYYASSCVYPKNTSQPIKEDSLLQGPVEETSAAYAAAKIAGIKLCEAFRRQYGFNAIVAVPATVYGLYEKGDLAKAHVIGALIGKFSDAVSKNESKVSVWGSGNPKREFLFSDDFVDASLFLMKNYNEASIINMGSSEEISIAELAQIISSATGFKGKIEFDASKPDGASRKFLDSTQLTRLGWRPKVNLQDGIKKSAEYRKAYA